MKYLEKMLVQPYRWSALLASLAVQGCVTSTVAPAPSESTVENKITKKPIDLRGDWCYERKRKITRYRILEDKLVISGGRSGQIDELDLSCNDAFTVCESKSIRGWGTPVTEILRLDGETMQLTRVWEGSWKGKKYNFTYTRCPKF